MVTDAGALYLAWPATAEMVQTSQGDNRQRGQGHSNEHALQPPGVAYEPIQARTDGTGAEIDRKVQSITAAIRGPCSLRTLVPRADAGR